MTIALSDPVVTALGAGVAPSPISILVVDDHALMRSALASLLNAEPDLVVIGQAGDGREALDEVRRFAPDVVLMDVTMPRMNGSEATRAICRAHPRVQIIAVSVAVRAERGQDIFSAGATDYVCKADSPAVLLEAIRRCRRLAPKAAVTSSD